MKRETRRARRHETPSGPDRNALLALWLVAALLLAASAAADNRIFLAEAGASVPVETRTVGAGDSFSLDLHMDFDDRTVGGGVLVLYDSGLLRLDDVHFDDALGDDASLRCPADPDVQAPISCPAAMDTISFGGVEGLTGPRRVASLDFSGVAAGTTPLGVSRAQAFSDVRGGELTVVTAPEPGMLIQIVAGTLSLAALRRCHFRLRRNGAPPSQAALATHDTITEYAGSETRDLASSPKP